MISRRPLVALLGALLLSLSSCNLLGPSNIEYKASGTATRVSLTYEAAGGTQQNDVRLPWSYGRPAEKGDFLYVSAQIIEGSGSFSSVTVEIYKGSKLLKSATSSGFASIATASTSLD